MNPKLKIIGIKIEIMEGSKNKILKINGVSFKKYTISQDGRVFSLLSNRYLTLNKDLHGYFKIGLKHREKVHSYAVHRIVAETYIPNPQNYEIVNHKDGNKLNNKVDNLEWCTYSQNSIHACDTGIREAYKRPVIQYDLDKNKIEEFSSIKDASIKTCISTGPIGKCCRGEIENCRGFIFVFKEDESKIRLSNKNRRVIQIDPTTKETIGTFENVTEASDYAEVLPKFMIKCCRNADFVYKGYIWKYADDDTKSVNKIRNFGTGKYPRIKIKGEEVKGYFVCKNGSVWSEKLKKYLKQTVHGGYYGITIHHNGKRHHGRIHRIVAELFIPNPKNYGIVNHKDGNKLNNHATNLEWCNNSQNSRHAHENGLVNTYKRPVVKFDRDGKKLQEYESVTAAAKNNDIGSGSILNACKGKSKSSGGFIWKYKDDQSDVKSLKNGEKCNVSVSQYDSFGNKLNEYLSIAEAAKKVGVSRTSISSACSGKTKTSAGFFWKYTNVKPDKVPAEKLQELNIPEKADVYFFSAKRVVKFNMDGTRIKEYGSLKEAAYAHSTASSNISRACNSNYKSYGGYIWAYKGQDDFILINEVFETKNSKIIIKCDLTHKELEEFYSAKEAAASVKVHSKSITKACNGHSKTSAGFVWKYKEAK